jgi:hypothetical protein
VRSELDVRSASGPRAPPACRNRKAAFTHFYFLQQSLDATVEGANYITPEDAESCVLMFEDIRAKWARLGLATIPAKIRPGTHQLSTLLKHRPALIGCHSFVGDHVSKRRLR